MAHSSLPWKKKKKKSKKRTPPNLHTFILDYDLTQITRFTDLPRKGVEPELRQTGWGNLEVFPAVLFIFATVLSLSPVCVLC